MPGRRFLLTALLAFAGAVLASNSASAQISGYPYRPVKPVFSPYLAFARQDAGALPGYFTFVRPAEDFQRYRSYLSGYMAREDRRISELSREVRLRSDAEAAARGPELETRSGVAPGTEAARPATFMNTSRFFPAAPTAPRR